MPICPHCGAELNASTLAPGSPPVCTECGKSLIDGDESADLSSVAGSPADLTRDAAAGHDSSIADSEELSLELLSETPAEVTLDSGVAPSALEREAEAEIEETLALGREAGIRGSLADSDDFETDFYLEEEDLDDSVEELEEEPTGEPSTSLDATIDLCHWAKEGEPEAESIPAAEEATIDLGGTPRGPLLSRPSAKESPPDIEATLAHDSGQAVPDPGQDSRTEATLPSDSDQASSMLGSDQADSAQGSAGLTDEQTLAFDSERRSTGVDTPEPIDITGLASGATLPRGPLGEGGGSGSLRPGESLLVGQESVRLRAFRLADPVGGDPLSVDYAIEGEAGKGGMGIVYKAHQQSLKRPVAIKQIKPDLGASDSDLNKFVSEAVITGQLEHPNIAPVHDLGLAADGLPFYAMKFVAGEDWEDSIKEKSEEENLGILIQVAQAIAFAHSKGVLHRDLKPGNVRLGSFGEVLVMDWGLAARLDGSAIQPAGTPIYMPPETALEYLDHARGKVLSGKRVESSRRRIPAGTYCDIYLLGALLFKIVTGRAPHRGKTTFECLRNAARNEIVKTRRKSELLDIAYRAMATEPEDRHATAIEFVDALKAYQSHAQSILIAKRASKDLREAGRLLDSGRAEPTTLYALFSGAQNGYQNALELWEGNRKAARRLKRTKRMFAESAYAGGDYDLALSLLDEDVDDAEGLRASVAKDQKSRNARLAWFRTLQYATAGALVIALGFIGLSFYLGQAATQRARQLAAMEQETTRQTRLADQATSQRLAAEEKADAAQQQAEDASRDRAAAEARRRDAEAAEQRALAAERKANTLASQAQLAKTQAERDAGDAKAKAERAAYFADLGRVRTTLLDRGAYAAWKEMQRVDPAIDDPAWRVLAREVDWRSEATELVGEQPDGGQRPTRLARSGNGQWIVAAASVGPKRIALTVYRSDRPNQPERSLQVDTGLGPIAADATGAYLAVAGTEPAIIDTRTGRVLRLAAEASKATCVAFHPSRPELLVGSEDTSVATWSVAESGLKQVDRDERWHQSAVTAVGYSPDGKQRVSADRSGRIVAWRLVRGEWAGRVSFHRGGSGSPRVTALSLANDSRGRIAAGYDDGSVYELSGWSVKDPAEKPSGDYAEVVAERLASRHPGGVTAIAYAEGDNTVLSSGGDTLLVQDTPSRAGPRSETRRVERRYHDASVLACLPAGPGQAFSADTNGRVVVWRLDVEARRVAYQSAPDAGRGAGVASLRLVGAEEEQSLVVADRDGFVRRWKDLRHPSRAEVRFVGHADHREFRAWHLGGEEPCLVTVAADNRAVVWRESDGLPERSLDLGGRTVVAVDAARGLLFAASDGREIPSGPQAMVVSLRNGHCEPLWDDAARVAAIAHLRSTSRGGPSVAVGLRDGQVYLWGRDTGRVELTPSSGRAHWRPIVALTHDAQNDRLLSADRGGLVAAWDLREGSVTETLLTGSEPITRIIPWTERRVVVTRGNGGKPAVLDALLEQADEPSLALPGLIAVAGGVGGDLRGLVRRQGQTHLLSWSPTGWLTDAVVPWRATGLATTEQGTLMWGPGVAQLWGEGGPRRRVVSRTPVVSLVESADREPHSLMRGEVVVPWDPTEALSRLPLDGRLVMAFEGIGDSQAILAIADQEGRTRVESWDLATRQRVERLVEPLADRVEAITPIGRGCAVALRDSILFAPEEKKARQSVKLPEGIGSPRAMAVSPTGQSVAVVTARGELLLASRDLAGLWTVALTDQNRVDSAAFGVRGDRLLVGTAGGRVEMLDIGRRRNGVHATRRLLSLSGHGDRVTHLRVESAAGGGTTLLSGDASGLVLARPL